MEKCIFFTERYFSSAMILNHFKKIFNSYISVFYFFLMEKCIFFTERYFSSAMILNHFEKIFKSYISVFCFFLMEKCIFFTERYFSSAMILNHFEKIFNFYFIFFQIFLLLEIDYFLEEFSYLLLPCCLMGLFLFIFSIFLLRSLTVMISLLMCCMVEVATEASPISRVPAHGEWRAKGPAVRGRPGELFKAGSLQRRSVPIGRRGVPDRRHVSAQLVSPTTENTQAQTARVRRRQQQCGSGECNQKHGPSQRDHLRRHQQYCLADQRRLEAEGAQQHLSAAGSRLYHWLHGLRAGTAGFGGDRLRIQRQTTCETLCSKMSSRPVSVLVHSPSTGFSASFLRSFCPFHSQLLNGAALS